jgi:beta-galactosidase
MKLSHRFFGAFVCSILLLSLTFSCNNSKADFERNLDFNPGWKYMVANMESASDPSLDDSDWKSVDLPHDWSIEDYEIQDSEHIGPFYKDQPMGGDIGFMRTGTCWYRKVWRTPASLNDKQAILNFDGVQTQMELWINGKMVGNNVYGYSPLNFNITEFLASPGEENLIAVKTVNTGENSRWFAGAGIYREVNLSILDPISVADWGVGISCTDVSKEAASVNIEVTINNFNSESTDLSCETMVKGPEQSELKLETITTTIEAEGKARLKLSAVIKDPSLWDMDNPNLYTLEVSLFVDGKKTDTHSTSFGVRSIYYSADKGFLLNGEEVLMKGGCLHHDNGILGAAAFKDAEYRRVQIMKNNGFNAIRTSHNPPSAYFLEACDELGMLVIDEAFDHWIKPKRPNDYTNYFEEWHKKDIQAMVLRDRNHPSIVMWSFGNEVPERGDPEGIEIGEKLVAAIKEIDSTRPTTQAVCLFWEHPDKTWDYSEGAFSMLDVAGYNYQHPFMEEDHEKFPERIMYGSESFPVKAWESWKLVEKHKYVVGDFVWTGMDYIGESAIGKTDLIDDKTNKAVDKNMWPFNAWCGDIDLIGNKKPQSYYRDILWGESKLEILVHQPIPQGYHEEISRWGWPEEVKRWNWPGQEDKQMSVRVFSIYPTVRLELNGEIIGEKNINDEDMYITEFKVPYQTGTLKAVGLIDGEVKESKDLNTAGEVKNISLVPEKSKIEAHRNSLVFIQVEGRDNEGVLNSIASDFLEITVSGPAELIAAGNASPYVQKGFQDSKMPLFRGKGLIILRSTGDTGEVVVTVKGTNNLNAQIEIPAI